MTGALFNDTGIPQPTGETTYEYTSDGSTFCLTATSQSARASFYASTTQLSPEPGACPGHDGYVTTVTDPIDMISISGSKRFYRAALAANGDLYLWGNNSHGQLGDGTTTHSSTPIKYDSSGTVLEGERIVQVVATSEPNVIILTDSGGVYGWGNNSHGQLGDGTETARVDPVAVATAGTPMEGKVIKQIAASDNSTFALDETGALYSWGNNSRGVLGINSSDYGDHTAPKQVQVAGSSIEGKQITQLFVNGGASNGGVIASDGTMHMWGGDDYGQLGNGTTITGNKLMPDAVDMSAIDANSDTIVQASSGGSGSVAIAASGNVYTWGRNLYNELANSGGVKAPALVPAAGTALEGVHPFYAARDDASIYIATNEGTAAAWGYSHGIWLGTGNGSFSKASPDPVVMTGTPLEGKTIVLTGPAMVVTSDGEVYTWGENTYGQLGDGTTAESDYAVGPVLDLF